MLTEHDVIINREQYKDRLREAEKERLIRQVTRQDKKPTLWQTITDLFSHKGETTNEES